MEGNFQKDGKTFTMGTCVTVFPFNPIFSASSNIIRLHNTSVFVSSLQELEDFLVDIPKKKNV